MRAGDLRPKAGDWLFVFNAFGAKLFCERLLEGLLRLLGAQGSGLGGVHGGGGTTRPSVTPGVDPH
jgi:hypothetical protein